MAVTTATSEMAAFAVTVDVFGLEQTLALLRTFDPELAKRLNAAIKAAMAQVAEAGGIAFPAGDTGAGKAGFGVKKSRAKIGYTAYSRSKEGAILEFAGRVNPMGFTPQGASLIQTLNSRYGSTGRFLWNAWDELGESAIEYVKEQVDDIEAEYTAKLAAGAVA